MSVDKKTNFITASSLRLPSGAFAMGIKGNVVLYLDKELVKKSKKLGFNLSKTFENQLKQLINLYSSVSMQNNCNLSKYKSCLVGPPGFEPGSIAPEATSLDQTSRRPLSHYVFQVVFVVS